MITLSLSSELFTETDYKFSLLTLADLGIESQITKTTSLVLNDKNNPSSGVHLENGLKIVFPSTNLAGFRDKRGVYQVWWNKVKVVLVLDCGHIIDENGRECCTSDLN